MRKYPAYKKLQDKWLREIPCEWRIEKIRALFDERRTKVSDKDYPALSVGKMGVVPQLETAVKTDNGDNRKLIKVGDFAINSRSDRKGAGGISEYDGSSSLIITVLKPKVKMDGNFVHYLMRSHYFSEEFYRNGQGLVSDLWTTKYSSMRDIELPIPSMQEQQQIVRYLDWKTSQINHLIHGYERLISLLEERKTAVINEAATKGIRKGVAMKDSGVEWLGYIPEHWQTMRCKMLFNELDLRSLDGSETHLSMSQKYGLIPEEKLKERHTVSESYAGAKICHKNDLVLNRLKAHLGVFALAPQLGVVSPDYTVLRVKEEKILPKFAEMVLKSDACRRELRIRVRGITEGFWRLYTDDFNTIVLPVPSLNEQKEILDSLVEKNARLDKARTSLQKEIELLRERRTRLISDVVTGALDVRDVVVPEYVQEQDMEVTEDGDEYEGERAGETDC